MVQAVSAAHQTRADTDIAAIDGLLPALRRLDNRLAQAIAQAHAVFGPEAATDHFRGLHISDDEVIRLLARPPAISPFPPAANGGEASAVLLGEAERLVWLGAAFGLAPFDLDLLLIALAPELDLRYERLYAFLQDDVSRRRPSVDLALNLLCASSAERLARRRHVAADAPLLRHGLLRLVPDSNQIEPSLLSHYLKPDPQIVAFVVGETSLDRRLAPFCTWSEPLAAEAVASLGQATLAWLRARADDAAGHGVPLRLVFAGAYGSGKRTAAAALAATLDRPLLVADLGDLPIEAADALRVLFRTTWFADAVLYLERAAELRATRPAEFMRLLDELATSTGLVILGYAQPWVATETRRPLGLICVPFPRPNAAQRQASWQHELAAAGLQLPASDISTLAERFQLSFSQIAEAVTGVGRAADSNHTPPSDSLCRDLFAAARAQSSHDLEALAHKITPLATRADIVLPDDALDQLSEICQRVACREQVLSGWGFGRKLAQGTGVAVLFAGPSGTGKTMAAEIIANELGLDLYKIDLASVVSKYIGETERNLDLIFKAAEHANAILFFDEADALFGKRSEVRDSHDRYANIESAYLLQKMEQYAGVAILATNLRGNLDEAFTRRLAFAVHFPFPDTASRRRIWASIWPPAAQLANDVDLDRLAAGCKLSGGNIKNIALAASFLAVDDGGAVRMAHLLHAVRREYQKMGKHLSAEELAELAGEIST